MTGTEIALALALIELILKYGAPAAITLMHGMDANNVTIDDIKALHDLVKAPEEYFED